MIFIHASLLDPEGVQDLSLPFSNIFPRIAYHVTSIIVKLSKPNCIKSNVLGATPPWTHVNQLLNQDMLVRRMVQCLSSFKLVCVWICFHCAFSFSKLTFLWIFMLYLILPLCFCPFFLYYRFPFLNPPILSPFRLFYVKLSDQYLIRIIIR